MLLTTCYKPTKIMYTFLTEMLVWLGIQQLAIAPHELFDGQRRRSGWAALPMLPGFASPFHGAPLGRTASGAHGRSVQSKVDSPVMAWLSSPANLPAQELLPGAEYYKRNGFPLKKIIKFARNRDYTDLIVVNEDRKEVGPAASAHACHCGPRLRVAAQALLRQARAPAPRPAADQRAAAGAPARRPHRALPHQQPQAGPGHQGTWPLALTRAKAQPPAAQSHAARVVRVLIGRAVASTGPRARYVAPAGAHPESLRHAPGPPPGPHAGLALPSGGLLPRFALRHCSEALLCYGELQLCVSQAGSHVAA